MYSPRANSVRSPFLRLPAELRNKIYQYAFQNNTVLVVPERSDEHQLEHRRELRGPMALWICCRQVYHEAMPLYMSLSTFDLEYCTVPEQFSMQLLNQERSRMVTSIKISPYFAVKLVKCAEVGHDP